MLGAGAPRDPSCQDIVTGQGAGLLGSMPNLSICVLLVENRVSDAFQLKTMQPS